MLPTTTERVSTIRKLMSELAWCGAEERRLRQEWGCSTALVRTAAAEASRQLAAVGDATHDRRRIELWIARAEKCADRLLRKGHADAAARIYVDLTRVLGRIAGLDRVRLEVEQNEPAKGADLLAMVEAGRAQVAARKAAS